MSNQWFRMYAEFAHDPKVQMLDEKNQRRLVMLFCMRCNGEETFHDEEVTFQLRVSQEEWHLTKELFLAKGFIDEANNLINWDKRQFRSDTSTERVRRHREVVKQLCNVSETSPEQNRTDTEQKERVAAQAPPPHPKNSRGTRLSKDWDLPDEWGEWAESQGMKRQEIIAQCDRFKDYWIAKAGKDATKADWEATWRNWVRKYLGEYAK